MFLAVQINSEMQTSPADGTGHNLSRGSNSYPESWPSLQASVMMTQPCVSAMGRTAAILPLLLPLQV